MSSRRKRGRADPTATDGSKRRKATAHCVHRAAVERAEARVRAVKTDSAEAMRAAAAKQALAAARKAFAVDKQSKKLQRVFADAVDAWDAADAAEASHSARAAMRSGRGIPRRDPVECRERGERERRILSRTVG